MDLNNIKNDMDNMEKPLIKIIEANGDRFLMNTEFCTGYKKTHKNKCFGCSSQLGCDKLVALRLNVLQTLFYQPKNFEDFQSMNKKIAETQNKILEAKTHEEIKALI